MHFKKAGGYFFGRTSFAAGVVILVYLLLCFVFLVNKALDLDLNVEFLVVVLRLGLYLTFILAPLAILSGILSRYFSDRDTSGGSRSSPKRKYFSAAFGITSGLAYYVFLLVTLHRSGLIG